MEIAKLMYFHVSFKSIVDQFSDAYMYLSASLNDTLGQHIWILKSWECY